MSSGVENRIARLRDFGREAFGTPFRGVLSIAALGVIFWLGAALLGWLALNATPPWADVARCRAQTGACWPFVFEKTRFILFGTYPFDQHWRPALTSLLLCGLCVLVAGQMLGRGPRLGVAASMAIWAAGVVLCFWLMGGGVLGLSAVPSVRWSGLPVLLILAIIAIALAFPLGVLLAMARTLPSRSLIQRLAAAYVELARGVPMVTVIFVGVFVLPLTLPPGSNIAPIPATLIALIFFHAAYFAEDVRGGVQSLPAGQMEAAQSLGFNYWQRHSQVILPQAVNRSLPALMNSIIGAYKDTSLVVVLGIHDLTATARMSFSDPGWRGFALEAYALVGLWFFLSCAFLSAVGRRLRVARPE